MMQRQVKLLTATVMAISTQGAVAGFVDQTTPVERPAEKGKIVASKPLATEQDNCAEKPAAPKPAQDATIEFVGREPAIIAEAVGFGRDIPLKDALRQIVPQDIRVYSDDKDLATRRVSWKGGKDWTDVLRPVLESTNSVAEVDWDDKTISIKSGISAEKLAAAKDAKAQTAKPEKAEAAKPEKVWELKKSDGTFRHAFSRWAKDAGWSVDWAAARDFPVTIEAIFKGELTDAIFGVLQSVSNSDYPLYADAYEGNRAILIKRYENKGAPAK